MLNAAWNSRIDPFGEPDDGLLRRCKHGSRLQCVIEVGEPPAVMVEDCYRSSGVGI
jgi:hypothetical protein